MMQLFEKQIEMEIRALVKSGYGQPTKEDAFLCICMTAHLN